MGEITLQSISCATIASPMTIYALCSLNGVWKTSSQPHRYSIVTIGFKSMEGCFYIITRCGWGSYLQFLQQGFCSCAESVRRIWAYHQIGKFSNIVKQCAKCHCSKYRRGNRHRFMGWIHTLLKCIMIWFWVVMTYRWRWGLNGS